MSKDYHSQITGEDYSKADFIQLLLKRIKKDLRNNESLDMNQNYALLDCGVLSSLCVLILKELFEGRLNVIIVPEYEQIENVILLDDSYLEKYLLKRIDVFFNKDNLEKLKSDKIPILRSISYDELIQLKNIFEVEGLIEKETNEFIEKLNSKYSQTKSSFLKSFVNIDNLLNPN